MNIELLARIPMKPPSLYLSEKKIAEIFKKYASQ
jgi:hypothetical protein